MAYLISNGVSVPHASGYKDMLATLKVFAENNGWVTMRWVNSTEMEWIAKGPGLSGKEHIYIGIATYSNPTSGIFNWRVATFTDYVAENTFATQPGATLKGIPLSNGIVRFWFILNAQRLIIAANVNGYPEIGYLGKYLPYATPTEYPNPLCTAGMVDTQIWTRFDTSQNYLYTSPFRGGQSVMSIRHPDGYLFTPKCWPLTNTNQGSYIRQEWQNPSGVGFVSDYYKFEESVADTAGKYPLLPVIITDTAAIWGELDGVYWLSRDGHRPEDIIQVEGVDHVVISDLPWYGFLAPPHYYFLLRLS